MAIKKEKLDDLKNRMEQLDLKESDLVEKFILGSGKGGQKIQKTSSAVYLKHLPTGIEIKCQKGRSRELNRYYARKELISKIEQRIYKDESEKQKQSDKIRRQKKRRSRRQKEKMVAKKRHLSEKKSLRKKPSLKDNEN